MCVPTTQLILANKHGCGMSEDVAGEPVHTVSHTTQINIKNKHLMRDIPVHYHTC